MAWSRASNGRGDHGGRGLQNLKGTFRGLPGKRVPCRFRLGMRRWMIGLCSSGKRHGRTYAHGNGFLGPFLASSLTLSGFGLFDRRWRKSPGGAGVEPSESIHRIEALKAADFPTTLKYLGLSGGRRGSWVPQLGALFDPFLGDSAAKIDFTNFFGWEGSPTKRRPQKKWVPLF